MACVECQLHLQIPAARALTCASAADPVSRRAHRMFRGFREVRIGLPVGCHNALMVKPDDARVEWGVGLGRRAARAWYRRSKR